MVDHTGSLLQVYFYPFMTEDSFFYIYIYIQIEDMFNICYIVHSKKNAGLKTTQCWVKYGQTQRLVCFQQNVGLNV